MPVQVVEAFMPGCWACVGHAGEQSQSALLSMQLPARQSNNCIAQSLRRAGCPVIGCRAVPFAEAAVLVFLSAAAKAGIIATNSECFHRTSMDLSAFATEPLRRVDARVIPWYNRMVG